MDADMHQQAIAYITPNMIADLFIDELASNKCARIAHITDTLGHTRTWEVRLSTKYTTNTADAILRIMADTENSLGDMHNKINDVREVSSRYSRIYGAWATDYEDEKLRVARLKVFRADEYIHEAVRLPLHSNSMREHKKVLVRRAFDAAKQAKKNLVRLGEHLNEYHGCLGDGALFRDKRTLAEALLLLSLWATAFEQELFN